MEHRAHPGAGRARRGRDRSVPATREAGRDGPHHRWCRGARRTPRPTQCRRDGRRSCRRPGHGHARRRRHAIGHDRRPLGSWVALRLGWPTVFVQSLVVAGVAAGISATFLAQLSAVFFALEVVLGGFGGLVFIVPALLAVAASAVTTFRLTGTPPVYAIPPNAVHWDRACCCTSRPQWSQPWPLWPTYACSRCSRQPGRGWRGQSGHEWQLPARSLAWSLWRCRASPVQELAP